MSSLYHSLQDSTFSTHYVIMYCVPGNVYFQISNGTKLFTLTTVFVILQILSHSPKCWPCHTRIYTAIFIWKPFHLPSCSSAVSGMPPPPYVRTFLRWPRYSMADWMFGFYIMVSSVFCNGLVQSQHKQIVAFSKHRVSNMLGPFTWTENNLTRVYEGRVFIPVGSEEAVTLSCVWGK